MRVAEALLKAREVMDAIDARVLLQYATGLDRAALIAHPERELTAPQAAHFASLVSRRAQGEPIAYLTGTREFYGREFITTPAVLIPRPETEHLVDIALKSLANQKAPRILDLGTGSGAIAITLALERPDAQVIAADISNEAQAIAEKNARRLNANVIFKQSNWYAALESQRFDLIVSNPPYIAAADPHLNQGDLRFEPHGALTDNSTDGMASLRAIMTQAPQHLAPGGWLWVEHGFDQAAACRCLLQQAGFESISSEKDLAGIERLTGGAWPAEPPSRDPR